MANQRKPRARIGRPEAVPPAGRLTIQQVADELGVSYSTVYRLRELADVTYDESGVALIPARQVEKIRAGLRPSAAGDAHGRRAVSLRPDAKRIERWERAVERLTPRGQVPEPVSTWLARLADEAAARVLDS